MFRQPGKVQQRGLPGPKDATRSQGCDHGFGCAEKGSGDTLFGDVGLVTPNWDRRMLGSAVGLNSAPHLTRSRPTQGNPFRCCVCLFRRRSCSSWRRTLSATGLAQDHSGWLNSGFGPYGPTRARGSRRRLGGWFGTSASLNTRTARGRVVMAAWCSTST